MTTLPQAPPQESLDISEGSPDDEELIHHYLQALIIELNPVPSEVLMRLRDDIRQSLLSKNSIFLLGRLRGTTQNSAVISLARADILTHEPIFRLRTGGRCGYVDQMWVQEEFRGRGFGGQLLRAAETWFQTQGVQHVLLHAAPKATRFYAGAGYRPSREMYKRLL